MNKSEVWLILLSVILISVGTLISLYDKDQDGQLPEKIGGVDCDDSDPSVGRLFPELCDGKDNNCDGLIDEGCKHSAQPESPEDTVEDDVRGCLTDSDCLTGETCLHGQCMR